MLGGGVLCLSKVSVCRLIFSAFEICFVRSGKKDRTDVCCGLSAASGLIDGQSQPWDVARLYDGNFLVLVGGPGCRGRGVLVCRVIPS